MVTARNLLVAGFLLISFSSNEVRSQCSKQDYQHCVKLADPLLKDPHLIYPDNPRDIENVCRTWTFFVECVKSYTDRCFTEARRREFNKAVESPVSSIHKLCSMPDYRDDYLKHATCMKMTLTQDSHCGRHYRLLVSQVSGEAPTASVCCSHHMLRECVVDQAKNTCDPESAPYSATMLDKALSFLRDQCSNFIPNQFDCPGSDFYKSTPPSRAETDRRLMDQEPIIVNTRPTYVEVQTTATRSTMGSSARLPPSTMASSPSMSTSTTLDSRDIFTMGSSAVMSLSTSVSSPSISTLTSLDSRDMFSMGLTSRMPPSTMANSPSMSTFTTLEFRDIFSVGSSSARMDPSTMASSPSMSASTTLDSRDTFSVGSSSARMDPSTMASNPFMSASTTLDSRDIFSVGSSTARMDPSTMASSLSMSASTTLDSRDIFSVGSSSAIMDPSTMASSLSISASTTLDSRDTFSVGSSSARMDPSTMASSPSMSASTTLDSRGSGSSLHPSIPSSTRSEPEPWSPTVTTAQEENERSSFARGMTWRTVGGAPPTSPGTWKVSSSDIWLPSSRPPAMIDNAIDEPNQQGLGSEKMDNSTARPAAAPLVLASVVALLTCLASFLR